MPWTRSVRAAFVPDQGRLARPDLYARVTSQILAQLERGARPWTQPWESRQGGLTATRPLRANGEPYRGINVLMLWAAAFEHGYTTPIWMTFKQAEALGGRVRKGEKASLVVYANTPGPKENAADNDEAGQAEKGARGVSFMKAYHVFNVAQVDGLKESRPVSLSSVLDPIDRIDRAEAFFEATGADIRHGGDQAYYAPGPDRIQMPLFEAFHDASAYYAVLAHEMTHWTKAKHRLDRDFTSVRFGIHGRAMEELVAELGAAFLSADLGLAPEPREDHAAYLQHWIAVMRADSRAIFTAAAHAQKAADYLTGLQIQHAAER